MQEYDGKWSMVLKYMPFILNLKFTLITLYNQPTNRPTFINNIESHNLGELELK